MATGSQVTDPALRVLYAQEEEFKRRVNYNTKEIQNYKRCLAEQEAYLQKVQAELDSVKKAISVLEARLKGAQ